ncbi:hypothetical protein MPDQ_000245 [Monascus purpureus]|uniref:Uncharacterized protein n=1 Tax=Monascus purpureus TaxID=5098 RepID=A0A507QUA1_MONPU|nr:hypothetical protein MPDQ_000245 [Monascus purpureus]
MDSGAGVPSLISLSDDGEFAAQISGKDLIVHSHPASSELREMDITKVKESLASTAKFLKFSRTEPRGGAEEASRVESGSDQVRHLLCASDARVSVWKLKPLTLFGEIEGVDSGIVNVDFGRNKDEIIVFHTWNTKVSVFTLATGHSQIIKAPKFAHHNGYGYRPKTGQFAILLKPETTDLLTIHELRSYELINRANLPTVDAQGLKWSPDGRWIAIWEAASADGHHLKTYTGSPGFDNSFDLGVKSIEWSPATGPNEISEYLAIGKVDGTIEILRSKTFSCSISLSHIIQNDQHGPTVWRERHSNTNGDPEYAEAPNFAASIMTTELSGPARGVSTITFSFDGSFLATVDQGRPNIVWIWSIETTPRLASVLVHEHAVRQVVWHPRSTQCLITTVNGAVAAVRHWSSNGDPTTVRMPIHRSETGKYDARWLASEQNGNLAFWYGTTEDCVLGYLGIHDEVSKFNVLYYVNAKARSISGSGIGRYI